MLHSHKNASDRIGIGLLVVAALLSPTWLFGAESKELDATIRLNGLPDGEVPVVTAIAIHPRNDLLVTAGDDHLVRLWSLTTGQTKQVLRGHDGWVTSVLFDGSGDRIFTSGRDGKLVVWNLRKKPRPQLMDKRKRAVSGMAFHAKSQLLAATGFRAPLRVYQSGTGEVLRDLECPCLDTRAIAFSPDGKWLAGGGRNGKIRIWNLETGEYFDLEGHRRRVTAVIFASDSSLISSSEGRNIHVWDIEKRERRNTVSNQAGKILALTMIDSERFAASTAGNAIILCDVEGKAPYGELRGHTGSVAALVSRGDRLLSGSFDTTVRVWKIRDEEKLRHANVTTSPPVSQRYSTTPVTIE